MSNTDLAVPAFLDRAKKTAAKKLAKKTAPKAKRTNGKGVAFKKTAAPKTTKKAVAKKTPAKKATKKTAPKRAANEAPQLTDLTEMNQALWKLVTRKNGATVLELRKARGRRRFMTTLGRIARKMGKEIEVEGEGDTKRYFAV